MGLRAPVRLFLRLMSALVLTGAFAFPAWAQSAGMSVPAAAIRRTRKSARAHGQVPPASQGFDAASPVKWYSLSPGQRRAWLLLGMAQHGAAFFDARTTRAAMNHYRELDPLMRPFAHSDALYPVMQIAPAGLDWLGIRLARSRHRWLRRFWWLPQAAATAGFVWSGVHNLHLPGPAAR